MGAAVVESIFWLWVVRGTLYGSHEELTFIDCFTLGTCRRKGQSKSSLEHRPEPGAVYFSCQPPFLSHGSPE